MSDHPAGPLRQSNEARKDDEDIVAAVLTAREALPPSDRLTARMAARYIIDTLDAHRRLNAAVADLPIGTDGRPFIGCQQPVGQNLWCRLHICHDGDCDGVPEEQLPASADAGSPIIPSAALMAQAQFFDRIAAFLRVDTVSAVGAVNRMADYGLHTAAQITEFLDYVAQVGGQLSIKLDGYSLPYGEYQPTGPGTPERLLTAAMVFGRQERAAIAAAGQDPLEWLEALVQIGAAGLARGDGTPLALENHDPDEESVVLNALAAGMTPAALVALAELGVSNRLLHHMLGVDAVPADVLAADPRAAEHLAQIRTGQPPYIDDAPSRISYPEALIVLRELIAQGGALDLVCRDAQLLVAAGAGDAAEVLRLYAQVRDGRYSRALIRRAAAEGLTPQEWVPLIERIGSRAPTYDKGVLLPLRTLAEATDAGVSVRAWDENPRLPGSVGNRHRALEAVAQPPWDGIYPSGEFAGRVVELTLAGVSPGLVAECHGLFPKPGLQPGWSTPDAPGVVIDDILMLANGGLTLPLARELATTLRAMRVSVAQIAQALQAGITVHSVRETRAALGAAVDLVAALSQAAGAQAGEPAP